MAGGTASSWSFARRNILKWWASSRVPQEQVDEATDRPTPYIDLRRRTSASASGPPSRCSSSGALAVRRARAGRKLDLSARCGFGAPVTAEVGADVASAIGVEGESGWAAGGGVVAVAPFHEHDQGGAELASLVGEHILRPAGPLGIRNAFE